MGKLKIIALGSFRQIDVEYSAVPHGHTVAVDDAIAYLKIYRDEARVQDLRLREKGVYPAEGFDEAYKRGLLPRKEAKDGR